MKYTISVVVSMLLVLLTVAPAAPFELVVFNDFDAPIGCIVFHITYPQGHAVLTKIYDRTLSTNERGVVGSSLLPGKYATFWSTNDDLFKVGYGSEVEDGINDVIVTPMKGPGCTTCDMEEITQGIWRMVPLSSL